MPTGVSVIIPNWNGAALLETALRCVRTQEQVEETIVVDNGSSDHSVELAHKMGARTIPLGSNRGFAYAVNRGIENARAGWVLILNNDVELTPGWLVRLLERATATGAWFATGKLLDGSARTTIDGTFDAISVGGTPWRCGAGRPDGPAWNVERTIRMSPFTALLARKELFERAGLLDETFESYLEDTEFGIRCFRNNLLGVYVPKAVAYHLGSATLGRWHPDTVRKIARNQVLLVARHYPQNWVWRCGRKVLVGQVLWGALAIRHRTGRAWLAGKLEGIRRFHSERRFGPDSICDMLRQSEAEIRDLQKQTGFDAYWKLYFALT